MRQRRTKFYLVVSIVLYVGYVYLGISDYVRARNFDNFEYPLNIDIKPLIADVLAGRKLSHAPINLYPYVYLNGLKPCGTDKYKLVILVKTAMANFENRAAIRNTFGQKNHVPGQAIKVYFFVGVDDNVKVTQWKIDSEIIEYEDIIQMNFVDSYFNNTIKTMMSFRWVFTHCPSADFYLFTDDDMYISVPNLLEYVYTEKMADGSTIRPDDEFYAGYMFKSSPHRLAFSKWRVSLEEYPWERWPDYITAGAYVLSNKSMKVMYAASLFVKHFRFDDVYLGIVAKKAGVAMRHCDQFYFYKKPYTKEQYKDVIASHGYRSAKELTSVWKEQNALRVS